MQDADRFAAICREKGYNSTKSRLAQLTALNMAVEAFGDSDMGLFLSRVHGCLHELNDLTHNPQHDEDRAQSAYAIERSANELVGLADDIAAALTSEAQALEKVAC